MKKCMTVSFLLISSVLLSFCLVPASLAQNKPNTPDPANDGWHVDISPYLWFAGVHGTAGIGGHEASVHASFADVADYLNLGVMGAAEIRHKRLIIPSDFMWIKLTDKRALEFDQGATTAKAQFKQTIFTQAIGYRVVDTKRWQVDARFGIRYWYLNNSLSVQGPTVNNGVSATANWVDAVGGGRIQLGLTPKMFISVGGDAGGGSARSDYQVVGLVGFRVARKWVIGAGYRYMDVNYRPHSTFVYDVAQSGLLLGATWNVK